MTDPQAPSLRAGDVLMTRTAPCGVRFQRIYGRLHADALGIAKDRARGELTATPAAWTAFTAFARTRAL
ncbi:hypothetical protein ACFQ64_34365 [Streptomyces sp. NPDC056460]|uniref:hypothetical protein n=1 Tax=Streptomyces sp. NPDC056460 TaxID=3345825 RepID=UPI00369DD842